ncbi:hypothetical protein ANAEL_05160 [Anaerolineales bacterium]|nr:hypothetical protein ANAEL_05160 [Anaerolineales bacterium]
MDKINRFSLMIDALTALAEEEQELPASPAPKLGLPTLSSVLADTSPLPHAALFLGMAEDGLPVLLDLYDPVPGPILIVADQASGKTSFLQMIARATEAMHDPADVQSGIITPRPDEWKNFQDSQSVVGVYSTKEESSSELLQSLVTWAHNNRDNKQTILLLIDDLEAVAKLGQESEQNLRWLLLRGPSRRVWPIITLNASRAHDMESWLEFFRTRLFGCIGDKATSHFIASDSDKMFNDLSESQFTLREGKNWLNFWAPALD